MEKVAIYEAKNQLSRIVQKAENGDVIELTRHGKPAAVMMGINQFDELKARGRDFSFLYNEFRADWFSVQKGNGENDIDPFTDIRDGDTGRPVEL